MRKLLLLSAVLFSCFRADGTAIKSTLGKAIMDKNIIVSIRSNGGYCTKGLQVSLRNISCDKYEIFVEPGLIFKPDKPGYQDLVIAGGQQIVLSPDSSHSFAAQTFCAKSSASSPAPGVRYTFLKAAGSGLTNVLSFITDHGLNDYMGQHAVWCFTDDHAVNGVYDPARPEIAKEFSAYVASQKGVPAPTYYTIYRQSRGDGYPVFLPDRQKVVLDLRWTGEARNITASIYNEDGTIYRKVAGTEHISKEGHRLHVEFRLSKVFPGKYLVKVRDDMNTVYAMQEVIIE